MTCKSCSHQFLFDPQKDRLSSEVKLHDALFEKIIRHASATGTYHFTVDQFFSSARHFGRGSRVGCLIIVAIFVILATVGLWIEFFPFLFLAMVLLVFILLGGLITLLRGRQPKRKTWDRFLARWLKSGRVIPGLIDSPALQNPPPKWEENDIYDYGVSALLLCDRPETVDLLVLNQLHTQTNTLILTASGYPSYLLEMADNLLMQSPELPVYLLHDATADPGTMKKHCPLALKEPIDLGLAPHTLSQLKVLRKRFGRHELSSQALDVVPYRILAAALTHCLSHGVVLDSALGVANCGGDCDTDVSFG